MIKYSTIDWAFQSFKSLKIICPKNSLTGIWLYVIPLKCINIISKNGIYNLEIIKSILKSKIIKLENIELEISLKDDYLDVDVYDDNNLGSNFKVNTDILAKRLDIKTNKRIKLFT